MEFKVPSELLSPPALRPSVRPNEHSKQQINGKVCAYYDNFVCKVQMQTSRH